MAKKSTQTLRADIRKNVIVEKGGAWMLHLTVDEDGTTIAEGYTAWANLSAAKRYLKEYVISFTPRKSIKMTVAATDKVTNKPIAVIGELVYKVEARA